MSTVFETLPKNLLDSAFKCGDEFAWPRADALRVIRWAEAHDHHVIGAEVWVPSSKGPIIPGPYIYAWSEGLFPGTANTAFDYVRDFEWDANDKGFLNREPYFNLTLDSD